MAHKFRSIPRFLATALSRHPMLLAGAIAAMNRVLAVTRRRFGAAIGIACAVLGGLLALASTGTAALAVQRGLAYEEIVIAASALYAASFVATRRRRVELARARSWLIATPLVSAGSSVTTVVLLLLPLLARLLVAAAALLLVSLGAAVTVDDALQLSALIAAGGGAGALSGAWLARRTTVRRHPGSRYAPRSISAARSMPSSAALSGWPIAQAFAWSRPENARLLLAAAILSVPLGTGILAGLFIIATWLAGSYLVALLIALTRVARCASEWLRSTPIAFWAFAWPLARRVLLHQLCGTVVAIGILSMLGAPPSTAIYFGTVWMTLVVLVAALSLADCYRAQSPTVKTVLSMMAALVAEERAHGWGLSLAVALAALHLRIGAKHARA